MTAIRKNTPRSSTANENDTFSKNFTTVTLPFEESARMTRTSVIAQISEYAICLARVFVLTFDAMTPAIIGNKTEQSISIFSHSDSI